MVQLPKEYIEKMNDLLGDAAPLFFAEYEKPPLRGLRVNGLKKSLLVEEMVRGWEAVPWCEGGYVIAPGQRPGKSPLHATGLYYLQEPSAMAPAAALNVRPQMRVLDLCAAPGGKTGQLAADMQGQGILIANEIHPKRARILLENIERLGVRNAAVLNESPERLAMHFPEYFDAILVDAPCSGEGMFRREQEAVAQWSAENVALCHERQCRILDEAAKMLRPGGRLVYSTCTFNELENEGSLCIFLEAHPMFSLEGAPQRLMPHECAGEGQFYAVLMREDGGGRGELPSLKADGKPDPRFLDFWQSYMKEALPAGILRHKDWLYALPKGLPDLKGLRVLRAGAQLGSLLPGRFEPAHGLSMAYPAKAFVNAHELTQMEAESYLRGEVIESPMQGWGVVAMDGWPLGLVKGSGGSLKNHYPKGLRTKG